MIIQAQLCAKLRAKPRSGRLRARCKVGPIVYAAARNSVGVRMLGAVVAAGTLACGFRRQNHAAARTTSDLWDGLPGGRALHAAEPAPADPEQEQQPNE